MQYTHDEWVDEYIKILTDMHYLDGRTTKTERLVRDILTRCKDEYEMSRKLHDVYVGNITLDDFVERYAVCIEQ